MFYIWILKRQKFGLNSKESYVKETVLSKINSENIVNEYGFYLTKNEHHQLQERFKKQDEIVPEVKSYLKNNSAGSFAGVFVEQSEKGTLYVGLKKLSKKPKALKDRIRTIYKEVGTVKFYDANYSLENLNKIHKNIFDDRVVLKKQGINVLTIRTVTKENIIEVGLENPTKDKKGKLEDEYGDMLRFHQVDAETIKSSDEAKNDVFDPVQGGVKIENDEDDGDCSAGFSAYGDGGSDWYIVTAGHCYNSYDTENFIQPGDEDPNAYYIGGILNSNAITSGNVDAALISTSENHTSNYVYEDYSREESLTSYQRESDDYIGQVACVSGYHSDNCGTITDTYYSKGNLYDLNLADYQAIDGDSGGTP